MLCKIVLQPIVGWLARLLEAMDCASDFNVHKAINGNLVLELVLINDLMQDVFQCHHHAFQAIQGSFQVRVADGQ